MSLIVFVGVNLVGDPVDMLINPEADQLEIERVIRDLGLDRPVAEQYWYFMVNAFQGDLGRSFVFGANISLDQIQFDDLAGKLRHAAPRPISLIVTLDTALSVDHDGVLFVDPPLDADITGIAWTIPLK